MFFLVLAYLVVAIPCRTALQGRAQALAAGLSLCLAAAVFFLAVIGIRRAVAHLAHARLAEDPSHDVAIGVLGIALGLLALGALGAGILLFPRVF